MSESWARAMLIAYDRHQRGGKRQRVYGYPLGDGRWAYTVGHVRRLPPKPAPEPVVITDDEHFARLADAYPRCAQRARGVRGGGFKVAITDQAVAKAMGAYAAQRVYECDLPAPAIGRHWHLATVKPRKWPL